MAIIQLKSLDHVEVDVSLLTGNKEYERMLPKVRDAHRREEGSLGWVRVGWELLGVVMIVNEDQEDNEDGKNIPGNQHGVRAA